MTAAVRRNDPESFFWRVKIHRAASKKPPPSWGLNGGASVLRAKIVIFAYSAGAQRLLQARRRAGAQRLLQARSACCERRRREHGGPSAAGPRMFDHPQG